MQEVQGAPQWDIEGHAQEHARAETGTRSCPTLCLLTEIPQASTGISPFELLYRQPVWGALNVLCESWESFEKSDESIVPYVLSMRGKLDKMTELVQENLGKAQQYQKVWYNCTA